MCKLRAGDRIPSEETQNSKERDLSSVHLLKHELKKIRILFA